MRKAEIDRKFDEIVAFAEVGKFIDTPVKRYSSGMYVRLAFAVAAHLEPEILIVDEVLAVGDAAFQRKCLGKMGDVAGEGRTVLFVSHNMAAITRLCRRGIWLDNGKLKDVGAADEVVAKYFAAGFQALGELTFRDRLAEAPGSDSSVSSPCASGPARGTSRRPSMLARPSTWRSSTRSCGPPRTCAWDSASRLTTARSCSLHGRRRAEEAPDAGNVREPLHDPGDFLNYGQYFLSVGSDTPMIQSQFFVDRGLSFNIEQMGELRHTSLMGARAWCGQICLDHGETGIAMGTS